MNQRVTGLRGVGLLCSIGRAYRGSMQGECATQGRTGMLRLRLALLAAQSRVLLA